MATIPSIAMIPSGYKANKVYSVLPTDGSGDLDSARTTTATRVNQNGLIEEVAIGVPRLDYTDGGCPSLLFEGNSINLITYSEDFSNAYWTKSGASVTSGFSAPSVDSPLGAFKLVEDTSTSTHYIKAIDLFVSDSTDRVHSIYLKPINTRYIAIGPGTAFSNNNNTLIFDTQLGVWSLNSSTNAVGLDSSMDANGWWRIKIKSNSASGAYDNFMVGTANGGTSYTDATFTGDGVSGFYIFGAQVEEQSYATSYIPTAGTTISRTADSASKSGISSLINSTQGVFYVEMSALSDDGTARSISLNSGSSSNRVAIQFRSLTGQINTAIVSGGVVQAVMPFTISQTADFIKIALVYKVNDFSLYVNGVEVGTDLSGITFTTGVLNSVNFDDGSGSEDFYGKVKDLRVYKTILSSSELTTLTTI